MKKLLLLLSLLFVRQVDAQYVTIPDANFSSYLQSIVPSAMIGNQIDTTSAVVTANTYTINVSSKNISNLSGIQYFHSLTHLDCSGNSLTNFPTLPNSITNLKCNYNSLSLTCPSPLPSSLDTFMCYYSKLTALSTLPATLIYLQCDGDSLSSLPPLSISLAFLSANGNKLTNLPSLPNSLTYLECTYNQLTNLPSLPLSLLYLDCTHNQILTIPSLPDSLHTLLCAQNSLHCLPTLPNRLTYLNCSGNQLTGLPILPASLSILFCGNNNISCFPTFPSSIQPNIWHSQGGGYGELNFDISGNPFVCLPNYTPATSTDYWQWNYSSIPPLCNAGDPNNCAITCAVGIKQITSLNSQINIYPNPTSDQFFVDANTIEKLSVDLYDVNGRHVLSAIVIDKSNINIATLENGIYTMTIKTTGRVTNKKLAIVR